VKAASVGQQLAKPSAAGNAVVQAEDVTNDGA
jgi:hypothetical protein